MGIPAPGFLPGQDSHDCQSRQLPWSPVVQVGVTAHAPGNPSRTLVVPTQPVGRRFTHVRGLYLVSRRVRVAAVVAATTLTLAGTFSGAAPAFAKALTVAEVIEAGVVGTNVVVANTDGDGANLRSKPSTDAKVIDKVSEGTVLALRVSDTDTVVDEDGTRWWPVSHDGEDGWVSGEFLELTDEDIDRDDAPDESDALPEPGATFTEGDQVTVVTDDGRGINVRGSAIRTGNKVGEFGEGTPLEIISSPVINDDGEIWYGVTDGDVIGFVYGGYLRGGESGDEPADEPAAPVEEEGAAGTEFNPADFAAASTDDGAGLNIRLEATADSDRIGWLPDGNVVQIQDGPFRDEVGRDWYKVSNGAVDGYSLAKYLVNADGPVSPAAQLPSDSFMIYPLASYIVTQNFGCSGFTLEPWSNELGCYYHNGIDLAANSWTPILAPASGTITAAGWCDCGLGYYTEIDHGDGFKTIMGHQVQQPPVYVGQSVAQGELVGYVGSTGLSTGPHIHFIVTLNGKDVDPLDYL